jgi:hypothetical protein
MILLSGGFALLVALEQCLELLQILPQARPDDRSEKWPEKAHGTLGPIVPLPANRDETPCSSSVTTVSAT